MKFVDDEGTREGIQEALGVGVGFGGEEGIVQGDVMWMEMMGAGEMRKKGRFADLARTDQGNDREITKHLGKFGFENAMIVAHGVIIA